MLHTFTKQILAMKISKTLLIKIDETILVALKKLKATGDKCLLVTDNKMNLLGTVTDGDIRSALIKGEGLRSLVGKICNKKPKFINLEELNNYNLIKRYLIGYSLKFLPVLKKKKIIQIIRWRDIFSKAKDEKKELLDVVIMAGGKGSRLMPFTKILPKPLIPVNDKPLISHIMDNLKKVKVSTYWICVNYKWQVLKSFITAYHKKINLNFIKESKPLGTIGALGLIPKNKISENFIVTNCDILINSDIQNIIDFHLSQKSDLTITIVKKRFIMPYGECKVDRKNVLDEIKEKPKHDYFVNTGFYIFNKKILNSLNKKSKLDFNELIPKLKKNKFKILCYPIEEGKWADFGVWESYNAELLKLSAK